MKTALSTVITKEQLGQMANSTDVVVRLMNTTDYVDAKLSTQNISFLKQFYEEEVLGNKPNETLQQKWHKGNVVMKKYRGDKYV